MTNENAASDEIEVTERPWAIERLAELARWRNKDRQKKLRNRLQRLNDFALLLSAQRPKRSFETYSVHLLSEEPEVGPVDNSQDVARNIRS